MLPDPPLRAPSFLVHTRTVLEMIKIDVRNLTR